MTGPGESAQGGNGGTPERPGGDPGDQGYVPGMIEKEMVRDFRAYVEREGRLVPNPTHEDLVKALLFTDPTTAEHWGFPDSLNLTDTGALAEVNPAAERARNPKQTFFVRDGGHGGPQGEKIYWEDTVGFQPLERETFTALLADSLNKLSSRTVYQTERQVGAAAGFAFPVDTISDSPSAAIFSNNMFLDRDAAAVGEHPPLTVIDLPHDDDKIDPAEFGLEDRLGDERTGLILTDPETGIVLIRGFAYHGPIKKTVFTLMNHYLPDMGVFPGHASASEGPDGDVAWNFGLSGTGKSTIGNLFENRKLIGDDELMFTPDGGTANMEGGVYPIILGISAGTEPALFGAAFTPRPPAENRAIFQNVVVGEDGHVHVDDASLTANTRVSVPMEYIPGSKESGEAGPPQNIFFITKDVGGTLPPIARLTPESSMFWFLMGPTSTTAAEVGGHPGATFSRFFGSPFMSRHPSVYMEQLGGIIEAYQPKVWLVNTGFTGGPEGAGGERIGIPETKAMVGAALSGELDEVAFREDPRFKIMVPESIPGSETASDLLVARDTWKDKDEYDRRANAFAAKFLEHFQAKYAGDPALAEFEQFSPTPLEKA
jgi:phosphoenolpyruvate carboxykinase (ATP)